MFINNKIFNKFIKLKIDNFVCVCVYFSLWHMQLTRDIWKGKKCQDHIKTN